MTEDSSQFELEGRRAAILVEELMTEAAEQLSGIGGTDLTLSVVTVVCVLDYRGEDGDARETIMARHETSRPHVQAGIHLAALIRSMGRWIS